MDGAVTHWDHARAVLPFRDISEDEVLQRLSDARAQLWTTGFSAAVTEITDDNWLHVVTMGGVMADVAEVLPAIERFAKFSKCQGVRLEGRAGWRRALKKYGYAAVGEEVVKFL